MQINALLHIVNIHVGLMQGREKERKKEKGNPSGNSATQSGVGLRTGSFAQPQDMATAVRYKLTHALIFLSHSASHTF